jgi:DNA-cytosine methyltransferase
MNAIDLFCGAGGFSTGFEQAGINVQYGIDINEVALDSFRTNHSGSGILHDISEGIPEEISDLDIDVVFGSPPCKGFSDARGSRRLDDERNQLVFSFIQWVDHLQPKYLMMENVAGMTTISDEFLQAIEKEYREAGYVVNHNTLNAANFGVPQTRKRVIYFGVREDRDIEPSLPEGNYRKNVDGQMTLSGDEIQSWVTVSEAVEDLPAPTKNGEVDLPPVSEYPHNDYLTLIRNGAEKTSNHIAKEPSDDEITQHIVEELDPGEMYRSSRFGERYRQVWDLLSNQFSEIEKSALQFIAKHRSKKDFRMSGKSVGAVPDHLIVEHLKYNDDKIHTALTSLHDRGWIRTDEEGDILGYDLNTKSGIRPRYMRLSPDGQSNTILTTDFNPRDKLHPIKNRGLSLREGARIQSFPDSFRFLGSFNNIAEQIGNAVPPLMAKHLAEHLIKDSKQDDSISSAAK